MVASTDTVGMARAVGTWVRVRGTGNLGSRIACGRCLGGHVKVGTGNVWAYTGGQGNLAMQSGWAASTAWQLSECRRGRSERTLRGWHRARCAKALALRHAMEENGREGWAKSVPGNTVDAGWVDC
jgi:hypothetical protein